MTDSRKYVIVEGESSQLWANYSIDYQNMVIVSKP